MRKADYETLARAIKARLVATRAQFNNPDQNKFTEAIAVHEAMVQLGKELSQSLHVDTKRFCAACDIAPPT
jgi:hypothetical protein